MGSAAPLCFPSLIQLLVLVALPSNAHDAELSEKILALEDAVKQLSDEIEDERELLDSHTEQLEAVEAEVQDHSADFAMMVRPVSVL